MATYQIWGDVQQLAPDRFFVTVSAVPAKQEERNEQRTGGVATAFAATLEEAEAKRDEMVLNLGKTLRERGHIIVNVINE